jgi:hypothetical protein
MEKDLDLRASQLRVNLVVTYVELVTCTLVTGYLTKVKT